MDEAYGVGLQKKCLTWDEGRATLGEFRIFQDTKTGDRARLGEGVCRHVFLGCDGSGKVVAVKKQRFGWDDTNQVRWRGGCNANMTERGICELLDNCTLRKFRKFPKIANYNRLISGCPIIINYFELFVASN